MSQIDLQEYEPSELSLSRIERETLRSLNRRGIGLSLAVEDLSGSEGLYRITPSSTVGAVEVDGLSLLIRPKIGIPQLLSLACYAMGRFKPLDKSLFDFEESDALSDILALALASAANRAFARGLLHGYRSEDETLLTVRGRIRFEDQLRRRFNVPLPVEVRYDEFTDDILANQLVKAALYRLRGMTLRSTNARRSLARVDGLLDNVSLVDFPARDVPEVKFDRLNEHYRQVVGLSRLILRHSAFESDRGRVKAKGFLIDMNRLFQEFITVALQEALNVSERVFREEQIASLDEGDKIGLRPDLTWWSGGVCRFVGDAKYKGVVNQQVPNADIYQLLAYATALDLPGGMLIYAKGEAEVADYRVRHAGKSLKVAALDLQQPLEDILKQVKSIATRIRSLRDEASQVRSVA